MFSKSCLLNKSSLIGSQESARPEETPLQVHSARQNCIALLEVLRAGRNAAPSRWPASLGGNAHMKHTAKLISAACAVAALGIATATTPAQAQGKSITLCWAAWDPANALVELSKDFTAK